MDLKQIQKHNFSFRFFFLFLRIGKCAKKVVTSINFGVSEAQASLDGALPLRHLYHLYLQMLEVYIKANTLPHKHTFTLIMQHDITWHNVKLRHSSIKRRSLKLLQREMQP